MLSSFWLGHVHVDGDWGRSCLHVRDWAKIAWLSLAAFTEYIRLTFTRNAEYDLLLDHYFLGSKTSSSTQERMFLRHRAHAQNRRVTEPIYTNRELRLAIRNLHLGKYEKAAVRLRKVGTLAENRRKNIEKYRQLHTTQTARLRTYSRSNAAAKSDHGVALRHSRTTWRSTSTIWRRWSMLGQQLLKLGHPEAALEYLRTCVKGQSS